MQLSDWLKLANLSQKSFAKKLDMSPAAICRFINGSREPSIQVIDLIEKETSGAVRYEDWRGQAMAKRKEEANGAEK